MADRELAPLKPDTQHWDDWSQTWDAYGRMTCAKQATACDTGTARVQFTHDALDRARTRVNAGTTTTYTYTGISEQVARTVAGSVTTNFASTALGVWGGDKVADGLISDEPSCTPLNYCWSEQRAPVLA